MCKPSCCPGNDKGTGFSLAIVALIGLVVISAMARPVIHAAEELLQVALIAIGVLVGLCMLIAATILALRFRRVRRAVARQLTEQAAHGWHARLVRSGTLSYRDPRFIYRKFELTQPSSGCPWCDDKIAEWLYDSDLDVNKSAIEARRWS